MTPEELIQTMREAGSLENIRQCAEQPTMSTTPKERPILFSGPMVRAILEGRKTQTRRICKTMLWGTGEHGEIKAAPYHYGKYSSPTPCSYGQPGNRLWVKETFALGSQNGLNHVSDEQVFYRATDPEWDSEKTGFKWKPSIFMPCRLSRITLEITAIRAERLQNISREDCREEGCGSAEIPWRADGTASHPWVDTYKRLWESINGPESWDANPWVWVLTFKKIAP